MERYAFIDYALLENASFIFYQDYWNFSELLQILNSLRSYRVFLFRCEFIVNFRIFLIYCEFLSTKKYAINY